MDPTRWDYAHWLAALSLAFVALERLAPRYREQGLVRPGLATDLFYLVFNGHLLGVLLAYVTTPLVDALRARGALDWAGAGVLEGAHPAAQFALLLVTVDLLHWGIHNALHRVPALWSIHRVHHSIERMDFLGNLRFHWGEVVFYKTLTYPLLAFFGARGDVLLALAVVNTAVGHWNHANTRLRIGKLGYLINHPAMHIWHHVREDSGPPMVNFGITLSVWDHLFGTAYVARRAPGAARLRGGGALPAGPAAAAPRAADRAGSR